MKRGSERLASKRFEDRILTDLLPEFCADPARRYDLAGFRPDFDKVVEVDGEDFLGGLDAGLVTLVGRLYQAPRSRAGEQFFWEHERSITPRPITLWLEPIITVAALARLHLDLGWPKELLGTQSVDWAFDVAAYREADPENEHVAGEVKKTTREADRLIEMMQTFGATAPDEAIAGPGRNAYRKVKGLRARRAPLLWVVGPGGYGRVFNVHYSGEWQVELEEATARELLYQEKPDLPG